MKRNLKALGLALFAVFAMSALAAVSAQAANTKFTAAEYPAALTGNQEGATNFLESTPGAGKIECTTAQYEGTLTAASTELTIRPHYEGCKTNPGGLPVEVHLNGCDFLFTAGETGTGGDAHGLVHLVCPVNQTITITVSSLCIIHIPAQTFGSLTASKGVTYTNIKGSPGETEKDYVTVDVNITTLKYTDTDEPSPIFCPFNGNTTAENGTFVSSVRVKAYKDLGTHTPIGEGTKVTELPTNTEGALLATDLGT